MTLEIKIVKISGKFADGDLYLIGSQAGNFKICSSYSQNDIRRNVCFSATDSIQFLLFEKDQQELLNIKAFTKFSCQVITQFIERANFIENDPIKFDIELFSQKDQPVATVNMTILYKKGLLLQGIIPICGNYRTKLVRFFKGNELDSHRNLFNVFDHCLEDKGLQIQFNPIQKVYKDYKQ